LRHPLWRDRVGEVQLTCLSSLSVWSSSWGGRPCSTGQRWRAVHSSRASGLGARPPCLLRAPARSARGPWRSAGGCGPGSAGWPLSVVPTSLSRSRELRPASPRRSLSAASAASIEACKRSSAALPACLAWRRCGMSPPSESFLPMVSPSVRKYASGGCSYCQGPALRTLHGLETRVGESLPRPARTGAGSGVGKHVDTKAKQ
jgi:hypothetical protein